MYDRFTDRARKVMQLANQEAMRFNHEYIGTEHILLGLISEGSGVAGNVLKSVGIDLAKVRHEVENLIQMGPELGPIDKRPQTPRTKNVIKYAIAESRSLKRDYVGTEHILLGLLRETEGVAAVILMNMGLTLDGVRNEVLNLLGNPQSKPTGMSESKDRPTSSMTASAERAVASLYQELLGCWNKRSAADFAALFTTDANLVGFDGSTVAGQAAIAAHLSPIFALRPTAEFIGLVKSVRLLTPEVAVLTAVAGMVPPGKTDINPAVNAVQTLVVVRQDGRWRIAVFHNTPAAFHGRPELSEQLTAELRQAPAERQPPPAG